jgi:diacylglycerol kinase (ATP)
VSLSQTEPRLAPAIPERFVVVANANASGHALERARAATARLVAEGRAAGLVLTRSIDELQTAWPSDPATRVLLCGGDGSVHAVANLPGPARAFALLPCGRANNIAHSLDIPVDVEGAIRVAQDGSIRLIDCIAAASPTAERRVVEGLSVGFLADARSAYHAANSADIREALSVGANALRHFHPHRATIEHAATRERLEVAQLFVANLPLYAFGLHVAPLAHPDDGLLDFVAIEARTRHEVLAMLARLHHGSESYRREVHCWRGPCGRIETPGGAHVIADSFDLGPGPIELQAVRRALGLVVPC